MIIFTGGKTAGHIYPLIVLMKEVKKKSIYIGYKDSLEEKICIKENMEFIGLSSKKNKYLSSLSNYFELIKKIKVYVNIVKIQIHVLSFKMSFLLTLYFNIFQLISSRVAPNVTPENNFIIFNKNKRLSFPLYY